MSNESTIRPHIQSVIDTLRAHALTADEYIAVRDRIDHGTQPLPLVIEHFDLMSATDQACIQAACLRVKRKVLMQQMHALKANV